MRETKTSIQFPRFEPNGARLTTEQIAIQVSSEPICVAMASAGTGKTTTLVARIGEALANGIPPEQILALTFTTTAANVLRERLHTSGIHHELYKKALDRYRERIRVCTFDEFSQDVLDSLPSFNEHARKIARDTYLAGQVAEAMDALRDEIGHRHAPGAFDVNHVNVGQCLEAMRKLKASGALFDDIDDEMVDEMLERLEITRAQYAITQVYERNRVGPSDEPLFRDRFDAVYDLAQLINRGSIAPQYFAQRQLIVCDEQHDFNEASYRVLRHLLRILDCRFVGVGDKDQVIHSAMGASDIYMGERFRSDFLDAERYPLKQTFRHGPHIAYPSGVFKQKTIESFERRHTPIDLAFTDGTNDGTARAVLANVQTWLRNRDKRSTCAVLLRDWHQSAAIEEALWRAEISFTSPDKEGFHFREEIRFVRAIFALALGAQEEIDANERHSVASVLAIFANIRLVREQYAIMREHPEMLEQINTKYLLGASPGTPAANVGKLVQALRACASTISAREAFLRIRQSIDFPGTAKRLYPRPYDADLVERSLRAFESTLPQDDTPLRMYFASMMERLSTKQRTGVDSAVIIDTVSNIKGKEYDHVVIPFLERNEFPNPLAPLETERNLFYVALTRAKSSLTIITTADTSRQSRFLEQLDLSHTEALADGALIRNMTMPPDNRPSRKYLSGNTYESRNDLAALGAKYDAARRQIYIMSDMDSGPFSQWLRSPVTRRE